MLIDTINYFNHLAGNDPTQFDHLIGFCNTYLTNTLPSFTCLHGLNSNMSLFDLLNHDEWKSWTNWFNPTLLDNIGDIHIIETYNYDNTNTLVDQVLLKQIINKQVIVKNKIILVLNYTYTLEDWFYSASVKHVYIVNGYDREFYDQMIKNKDEVKKHIRYLYLLPLWCKLQYLKPFLIDDVITYTITLHIT